MRSARSLLACLLAVIVGLASSATTMAQPRDVTLTWHSIETAHFRIHYHEPLGLMARRVAAVAERAHSTLHGVMAFEPSDRVEVVITDESDSANGSATALPFDTIRLYAEPPEDLSPLSDYDDWLTTLVSHEHTHILQLDNASGLASIVNAILGKTYMPNHVNPRWLLEGYAVWQESERTAGGRLRSTQWDMYLRMDALEDRLFGLDQVTNDADRWPHGNAAYLYGSYFIRWIADHHGREALARWASEYGGSLVPYGLSREAERTTGMSLEELYAAFTADATTEARARLAAIEREGRREGRRLTQHGEIARQPRFTADGRLVYVRADARSRSRLVIVDPRGAIEEELARVTSATDPAIAPGGDFVVFSRGDTHRDIYFFSDLVSRDLATGDERRLTHGLRAREPDIAPNGRSIVFTTSRAGTTHLEIADLADVEGSRRTLDVAPPDASVLGGRFVQVYTPRFSPDGRTIACSRWAPGGYRDVILVDVASGRVEEITHDRAMDTGPVFSPDGRSLYFSSDRTGIANLYRYELASGALEQVTNVIGGAYQPAISPDGTRIAYIGYTSFGFDLFEIGAGELLHRPAPAYIDQRPPSSDTATVASLESHDYDPFPTLYPRSYLVDLGADSFGPQLGISTRGEDVLGFHSWNLRLGLGLARATPQLDVGYSYNRSALNVSASGYYNVVRAGGLSVGGVSTPWIQEAFGGGVSVGYNFPSTFHGESIGIGYAATYTRALEPFLAHANLDPNTDPPRFPETGFFSALRFGWSYSDVERYTYDISASNGRQLGVSVSIADPVIGSQYRVLGLTWFIQQYVPLFDLHVLALRYAGGVSGGDLDRRGVYGVGGFPTTAPLDSLTSPVVLGGVALRGYPTNDRVGTQYHLAQVEYRLPIIRFNRGYSTLPLYFNRVHAHVFGDVGDAFSSSFDLGTFRVGVGAEVLVDFTVFYLLSFTLRVGYARGLMEGGIDQFYGHLGLPF